MTKTERRFVALRVAGGLLPADFLGKVAALDAGQDIAAYGLTKSLNMRDEIGRHRRIASDLWADFRAIRASAQVERTADRWLLPFLSRVLISPSRGRIARASMTTVSITHRASACSMPLVLCSPAFDLDKPDAAFGEERGGGELRTASSGSSLTPTTALCGASFPTGWCSAFSATTPA